MIAALTLAGCGGGGSGGGVGGGGGSGGGSGGGVGGSGGGESANYYQASLDEQVACCNNLTDSDARSDCMIGILRVDHPEVQKSEYNKAKFACFIDHFECDPETGILSGRAGRLIHDCLVDLKR